MAAAPVGDRRAELAPAREQVALAEAMREGPKREGVAARDWTAVTTRQCASRALHATTATLVPETTIVRMGPAPGLRASVTMASPATASKRVMQRRASACQGRARADPTFATSSPIPALPVAQ